MSSFQLNAISPIDGRYANQTASLKPFFSEAALMRYRVRIEIEYFIALCELPLPQLADFPKDTYTLLRNVYLNFSEADAIRIKEIEKETNHDVKAVEYFIKGKLAGLDVSKYEEFIHFGLTSQDINNTAIPLLLKEAIQQEVKKQIFEILHTLYALAEDWNTIPMLARTHGQPASPTRLGKEVLVFCERLEKQIIALDNVPYAAKFGGATGNFNAHAIAYPEIDWLKFADKFVNQTLGLQRSRYTTQIEHYDFMAALCDTLKRINTILIDLARDFWQYISMEYFTQEIKAGEVGSSAMPHKVNPIDFENAEGNLGFANAIYEHLAAKLPISRLQRDLTDSTVLRNIGMPIAHSVVAYLSLRRGLSKIEVNEKAIRSDLQDNWAVVAEGIQTILRREGYPKPYEALKALTRNNEKITQESIHAFIDQLTVQDSIKKELKGLTPFNYVGI
ncbi:adenylosuccinate lyase [Cytophagaceae bacterium DM2B3-1]|uniref:Adenylosuccinate lyase n=1 Tax=Xanthocytophaga flava TaxID=3048013 RepID=A0ABT7CUS6_9BACT|nr:adenylosuccinate lyase [Xanthocytophaga flavus]MDJ1497520.1 adenylosuccinate lyase [Xanthocytophaga flavus]